MRPAPPLALQCAPSRAWRLACAFIGASAGGAITAWVAGHLEWALPAFLVFSGAAIAGGAWFGRRIAGPLRQVEVRWDGRDWQLDGSTGELRVMLDFDRWLLLLRHQPKARGRVRWVALSFVRGDDDFRALRTALYCPPPEPTPDLPHVRAPDRATD
ncbi:MAG: hypothetical protein JNN03_01110 [Rubrivivax sp.]|nr:hypothetical protein [Rubrivivax sp.]